jgi:xylulokinase
MSELLDQSPVGAKGLIALPYFEGERAPIHGPKARGVLFGLTLSHSRADIYRAILEGIGCGICQVLEEMRLADVYPKRLIAIRGGTLNLKWVQIISDICNVEMLLPAIQNGACFGDAFMVGVAIGSYYDLCEINKWVRFEKSLKPNPANQVIYEPLYDLYCKIYLQNKNLMHDLFDYQRGT